VSSPSRPGKGLDRLKLAFGVIAVVGVLLLLTVFTTVQSDGAASNDSGDSSLLVAAAVATPVFGGLGFGATSYFAWRRDKRESQQAALQMQKLNLEIAQMQANSTEQPKTGS
jgi:hypothetical protein